jgi:hypothetical protein
MKPRIAFVIALALLMGPALGIAAFPRQPVTAWIRDLYTAQASRIARAQALEEGEVGAVFTPEVAALWRVAQREASATSEREFDAFFGWRVPLGTQVSFTAVFKVLGTDEAPTLMIDVIVAGVPRRIVLDAAQDGEGMWRIANVTYDEGEDFVSFERKLAHR